MGTLEEAMAEAVALSDDELITPVNDILMINPETREIVIPETEKLFGVKFDVDVERKHFKCPKIVGDNIDLSQHKIYVVYQIVDEKGNMLSETPSPKMYWCKDMQTDETGDYITFSWQLSGNVFESSGIVGFKIVATYTDTETGNVKTRWNTIPAYGTVKMTLSNGEEIVEQYADVITQLLQRMDEVEAIATPEAMQGYVEQYLNKNPLLLDETLKANDKAAPANLVGKLKDDISNIDNNLEKSQNLYNSNKSVSGYLAGGNISPSDSYVTSDYIPVNIGDKYIFSNNGIGIEARFIAFYDLRPSGSYAFLRQVQNLTEIIIDDGDVNHIRVTFHVTYDKVQINKDVLTPFVPYGKHEFIIRTNNEIEKLKNSVDKHGLNNGSEYPTGLRCGFKVYYKSDITTFNSFLISRGNTTKEYISVGNTQIVYQSGDVGRTTVPHNLIWKDKCDVIIDGVDIAHVKVTCITNGGLFTHTFERYKGYGNEGIWETTGSGELVCQIDKPNDIWVIGDSYMSYADDRIGGALYEIGVEKPTIISIPGANTPTMAQELLKMSACYNVYPKTVVLCTGMNDSLTSYQNGLNIIENYCNEHNIDLIITAIPITPLRTVENIKVRDYVLSLNYIKIRFDDAVSSSNSGVWLEGCLNSDNIHPTQNGARLLAHELLNKVGYLVD